MSCTCFELLDFCPCLELLDVVNTEISSPGFKSLYSPVFVPALVGFGLKHFSSCPLGIAKIRLKKYLRGR